MALQYVAHQDPSPEQIEHWGDDWTGCKLWGGCHGSRCRTEGKPWRSPVKCPSGKYRPPGVHPERSRAARCPLDFVKPEDWRLVRVWSAWRQLGGMPGPGSVEEQDAKLIEAFAILDGEQSLITASAQEEADRRARKG